MLTWLLLFWWDPIKPKSIDHLRLDVTREFLISQKQSLCMSNRTGNWFGTTFYPLELITFFVTANENALDWSFFTVFVKFDGFILIYSWLAWNGEAVEQMNLTDDSFTPSNSYLCEKNPMINVVGDVRRFCIVQCAYRTKVGKKSKMPNIRRGRRLGPSESYGMVSSHHGD